MLVSPQLACYILKLVSNWWWFIVCNFYVACILFSINLVQLCFLCSYILTMLIEQRCTCTKLLHVYVLFYIESFLDCLLLQILYHACIVFVIDE